MVGIIDLAGFGKKQGTLRLCKGVLKEGNGGIVVGVTTATIQTLVCVSTGDAGGRKKRLVAGRREGR
jgi:hypothetical protein